MGRNINGNTGDGACLPVFQSIKVFKIKKHSEIVL
jgi:hypothetical protein